MHLICSLYVSIIKRICFPVQRKRGNEKEWNSLGIIEIKLGSLYSNKKSNERANQLTYNVTYTHKKKKKNERSVHLEFIHSFIHSWSYFFSYLYFFVKRKKKQICEREITTNIYMEIIFHINILFLISFYLF